MPLPAPCSPHVRAWCSRQARALPALAQGAAHLSAGPGMRTPERGCPPLQHLSHGLRFEPLLAEKNPCGSAGNAFHYPRECIQGQPSSPRPALTSDLRKAVSSRITDTGPPRAGHGASFIRPTKSRANCPIASQLHSFVFGGQSLNHSVKPLCPPTTTVKHATSPFRSVGSITTARPMAIGLPRLASARNAGRFTNWSTPLTLPSPTECLPSPVLSRLLKAR